MATMLQIYTIKCAVSYDISIPSFPFASIDIQPKENLINIPVTALRKDGILKSVSDMDEFSASKLYSYCQLFTAVLMIYFFLETAAYCHI